MLAQIPRTRRYALEVVAFAVARADLLDTVQGLAQGLLEDLKCAVFPALECLDLFAHNHREIDHHRVHEQDKQGQRPVDPEQHGGDADHGQHRDDKLAQRAADELVDRIHVGHEMRGHGAGAQGFVFGHGNRLHVAEQLLSYPVADVLCDQREIPGLQHGQHQRGEAQQHGDQHHDHNEHDRSVPARGQRVLEECDDLARLVEQHLVHHHRHQHGHRHAQQRGQDRDDISGN